MANLVYKSQLTAPPPDRIAGYYSCGCGGKPIKLLHAEDNEKDLVFPGQTELTHRYLGPATNRIYNVRRNTVAINIDSRDVSAFLVLGVARVPTPLERTTYGAYDYRPST